MKNKRILIYAGTVLILIAVFLSYSNKKERNRNEYIIDTERKIHVSDIPVLYKRINLNDPEIKKYFDKGLVNSYTLFFFRDLQSFFSSEPTLPEHLESVRKYLLSILPEEEAGRLFDVYRKFVDFETGIAAKAKNWEMPKNTDEALDLIDRMRREQYDCFGGDMADALFGPDMKMTEYGVRRSDVLNDNAMYGREKEERLKRIDNGMWAEDASPLRNNTTPLERYEEKLIIYKKDLDEMSEDKKKDFIRKLRMEVFPPEVVARFEDSERRQR